MKRCYLLFAVLFFSLVTFSQGFNYGVTAGLNVSKPKDFKSHVGFNIGVKGEYLFADTQDTWFLESALMLTDKGWKTDIYVSESEDSPTTDWKTDAYYLELPLMAGYKYGTNGRACLSVSGGFYAACGLFGKSEMDDMPDVAGIDNIFSDDMYKRFDTGLKLYIGVDYAKWQLGVSYSQSFLNPVKHWKYDNPKDRTVAIQLAYMINR